MGKDIFLGIIYKEISVSIFIGHIKEDHALVIGSCLDCGSLILIFCYRKASGRVSASKVSATVQFPSSTL